MRVFVYGTLKKGINNHHLLATAQYVGEAYTVDTFKMRCVGFPVITPSDDGLPVFGEVYDVDEDTSKRLDQLEAEGHMYDRKEVGVVFPKGQGMAGDQIDTANIYIGNPGYWGAGRGAVYDTVNEHGELEWRP